ncbi:hypothetical protein BB561_004013 [Smittium simulii]|uniref:Reverse transcriptase RNase H-like domain-containing protein n=1 Tax=Smittium simulii TaxID=133385 RepID=A0A2T9YIG7_9FUNG|nr:hypothetical protein BB561_004013 [Smittium simulii]
MYDTSLNGAATPAAQTNDAALYGIQIVLANMTRPIDDYVHRKLKVPTTRIQGNEDLEFAHMMRELLSDVVTKITQRINNLHKPMGLPGRVLQLEESTAKPLVENKHLDSLLAAKKPTIRSRKNKKSPFCLLQQTAFGTTSAMTHNPHNATPNSAKNNQMSQSKPERNHQEDCGSSSKEGNQAEERRPTSSSRSPETQQLPREEKFQNVIPDIHMQDNQEKGLYDLSGQPGYNIKMGKSNMTPFQLILIWDDNKLTNYEFKSPIRQEKLGKLYWKSTSNVGCSPPWLPNAKETFGIEKQFLKKSEIMDCHGDSEQSSNSELRILETETAKMERNTAWKIVVESQSYSVLWPPLIILAHINVKELLAVYYELQLHSVFGCSVLVYSDNTTTLAYVQKFGGTTSPKLLEVSEKLRAIKTDSSNGMVSINRDIQETEKNIWPIRRGSFCNKEEQEAIQILKLVPGQSISRSQRTESLLAAIKQLLMLSPVKSNTTDPTESSTGEDNNNKNNANVGICNLVFDSGKNKDIRAHTNTGVRDYARPKKRQISFTQEQILVADGMENQRRTCESS